MTTNRITRAAVSGVLLLIAGAGIACTKADASSFDSAYCHVARKMVANDIKPADKNDPDPDKTSWLSYVTFMDDGLATAPKVIHADWVAYHAAVAKQTAVVAKFGYNEDRFNAEATDADKAAMDFGAKVQAAQDRIIKYESVNCSSGQPPAADLSFKGMKPGAHCAAIAADDKFSHSFDFGDPASIRAFQTDSAKQEKSRALNARLISTAPKVIRDDVKAEVKWWETKQKSVAAKYGYDMVKLFLTGSEKDVQALQLTDPKVANHYARALAYQQKVCESDS